MSVKNYEQHIKAAKTHARISNWSSKTIIDVESKIMRAEIQTIQNASKLRRRQALKYKVVQVNV